MPARQKAGELNGPAQCLLFKQAKSYKLEVEEERFKCVRWAGGGGGLVTMAGIG